MNTLQQIKDILLKYTDPKFDYDGMSSDEIARKIMAIFTPSN